MVYSTSKASYHTMATPEQAGTLVATDYKDPPTLIGGGVCHGNYSKTAHTS